MTHFEPIITQFESRLSFPKKNYACTYEEATTKLNVASLLAGMTILIEIVCQLPISNFELTLWKFKKTRLNFNSRELIWTFPRDLYGDPFRIVDKFHVPPLASIHGYLHLHMRPPTIQVSICSHKSGLPWKTKFGEHRWNKTYITILFKLELKNI